ncbi:hypothetical protein ACFOD9_01110 [Novosphingobium bradum]|uniref:DUF1214 domain-containing protein n=1 Tax=Novosphingobium bradum TaxID=1737444 RepID=A0ABV7IPR2_9SPHN
MAAAALPHLLEEGGLRRALPACGGPNPDYRIFSAALDPARCYRLTGELRGSERVGLGIYRPDAAGAPILLDYTAFDAARCGPDGAFALELGPEARGPEAMALPPEARSLLIRVLHRDPRAAPARLLLDGAPPPASASTPTGLPMGDGAAMLAGAARMFLAQVREYLGWVAAMAPARNALALPPPELAEKVLGDADTQYFLGTFDLAPGEHLEIAMPRGITGYWSVHACSHWLEHLRTPGADDRRVRPDGDGRLRFVVGPDEVGGGAFRLDTAGRRRGALIGRVVGPAGTAPRLAPPEVMLRRH